MILVTRKARRWRMQDAVLNSKAQPYCWKTLWKGVSRCVSSPSTASVLRSCSCSENSLKQAHTILRTMCRAKLHASISMRPNTLTWERGRVLLCHIHRRARNSLQVCCVYCETGVHGRQRLYCNSLLRCKCFVFPTSVFIITSLHFCHDAA